MTRRTANNKLKLYLLFFTRVLTKTTNTFRAKKRDKNVPPPQINSGATVHTCIITGWPKK